MIQPPTYPNALLDELLGHSDPGTLASKNQITLHITQGSHAAGAIETFKSSVSPHRVSAHFVVDRDGTVYQLLALSEVGWHASAVNRHAIGIEHAAIANTKDWVEGGPIPPATLPASEAQYVASAALVAWLCTQLAIPCDRAHVRDHWEASPQDHHRLCCSGALDPDRVVRMAQENMDRMTNLRSPQGPASPSQNQVQGGA